MNTPQPPINPPLEDEPEPECPECNSLTACDCCTCNYGLSLYPYDCNIHGDRNYKRN